MIISARQIQNTYNFFDSRGGDHGLMWVADRAVHNILVALDNIKNSAERHCSGFAYLQNPQQFASLLFPDIDTRIVASAYHVLAVRSVKIDTLDGVGI